MTAEWQGLNMQAPDCDSNVRPIASQCHIIQSG